MSESRLYRLGRFCAARPFAVLLSWLLALAAAGGVAMAFGGHLTDDIVVPGSPAERGNQLIAEHFPEVRGTSAQLVFHRAGTDLTTAAPRAAVDAALAGARDMPEVSSVGNPWLVPGSVSADRATIYVDVLLSESVGELGAEGRAALSGSVQPARDAGLEAVVGGELAFATSGAGTGVGEIIGLAVAVVVLLIIFGSVLAAGMPLVVALCALGMTLAAVTVGAALTDVASEAPQVAALIGLGVGIDYALILITRHREELGAGQTVPDAIATATAYAGRSVLFAGGTVVVAVCALFLTGLPLIGSLGAAAAVVVAISVAAALTLLPAMLRLAGQRVLPRRRRTVPVASTHADGFWERWTTRVARRPRLWLAAGVAALALLASPALTIELTMPDTASTAVGSDVRRAHDLVTDAFGPGTPGPLFVVAETGQDPTADGARLADVLRADPGVASVSPPLIAADRAAVLLSATPREAPSSSATEQTVQRLRTTLAERSPTGGEIAVTGSTATYVDFSSVVGGSTPLVVGVVVGFCALLLLILFRSTAIALRAAVVNLLSLAASFGVVVAVFQWGWGNEVFGVTDPTPIASFVPLFLFAIVFGLSMDYEVFLISRIREETIAAGGDTVAGLRHGMAKTAHVITSAALIMISVFTAFAFSPEPVLKFLGLGLAVAVLLDATIVRLVVLPAAIAMAGDRTWRLPRFLDRVLPTVHIEQPPVSATEPVGDRRAPLPASTSPS